MSVQEELTKLRRSDLDPSWSGQPNEWLRRLPGPSLSDVAIQLVASLTGGTRNRTKSVTHKVESGGNRIDVKVATLSEIGGAAAFCWRNLRDLDRITHLAFLAIYPSVSRLFIVPVQQIPASYLKQTNVPGGFQIVITGATYLPAFLGNHEWKRAP